jgi:glycosyltransferase involved in cell wall biosynthesis
VSSLSVVIPYYKGAGSIAEAVGSVLDQTLPAAEIVIVDDGSPDDLEAALGSLRDRVRIVGKENGGISSAMNAATEAAEGEWIVQLDQDDAFLPGRLEAIAAAARAHPEADIVATGARIEFEGRLVRTLAVPSYPPEEQRLAIIGDCYFLWPAVRRARLLAVGGYDTEFAVMQDWECFIRLVLDGALTAVVDEPLYRWRLTPNSRSSADALENADALVRLMEKTLRRPDLGESEREAVERALKAQRMRVALERANHAVRSAGPEARRHSLAIARDGDFLASTRAKAALAVASPALARWLAAQRSRLDPGGEALAARGFDLSR